MAGFPPLTIKLCFFFLLTSLHIYTVVTPITSKTNQTIIKIIPDKIVPRLFSWILDPSRFGHLQRLQVFEMSPSGWWPSIAGDLLCNKNIPMQWSARQVAWLTWLPRRQQSVVMRSAEDRDPRLHVVTTLCCWTAGGDPLRLGQQATLAVPSRNRSQSSPCRAAWWDTRCKAGRHMPASSSPACFILLNYIYK